ncbi:hypothetical protein [Pedobacter terrae]|uniref:hypothetical protein n=1 Tax=Pedobacter terrae TaxID=405671 RepID=UPI002FF4CFDC
MQIKYIIGLLYCSVLATSCASVVKQRQAAKLNSLTNSYCEPTISYAQPFDSWADLKEAKEQKVKMSAHDQIICSILGIEYYIAALKAIQTDGNRYSNGQGSEYKQIITQRIILAQTQLNAVAAELDCEGERADMAGNYLDELNSKRNTRLTVTSVISGALTTVATALIKKNSVQNTVAISGGLLSAGLGALTINPKGRQIAYHHPRNLLRDIWQEHNRSDDFPVFVWRMLQEKALSNTGQVTLANSIKNRWTQFELDGKANDQGAQLLFGDGGMYRADELHARSAMLNQLQSTIRSLNQDLASVVAMVSVL